MPKRAEWLREINFFASGGQFWSKNLTSMAPAGKLIIDQKRVLKTFSFFYSYDWRPDKLIIDLKKYFEPEVRGTVRTLTKNFPEEPKMAISGKVSFFKG